MKTLSKWIGISLIFTVFLLSSCSKEETTNNELDGNWVVVSFEDYPTSTSITKTEENTWYDYNNGDITVNLSFSENGSGMINGKNVTNTFKGDFEVQSDKQLTTDNFAWTNVAEPEWGQLFHVILLAESYEIVDHQLVIYYNNKENAIVLERP